MNNYVIYIDNTYSVKVKSVEYDEGEYLLKGVDTDFFIAALFVNNKRVDSVAFSNVHNLFMLSVINDLSFTDLNVIPLNYFFEPNKEVRMAVSSSSSSSSSPSAFSVNNFQELMNLQRLRYLKVYTLPQYTHYRKFITDNGAYSFEDKYLDFVMISGVQSSTNFAVTFYDRHRNDINLYNPATVYDSIGSYVPQPYNPSDGYFPSLPNSSVIQFGDFYIKVTAQNNYPYDFKFYIFKDVRTNEIWCYVGFHDYPTNAHRVELFDLNTLLCVNGGFEIKHLAKGVTLKISNIYG